MNDLQKKILNIYKHVADICIRNEIPFYSIGGTCLGAVRHNGFIPWDDDLDIAIPIEEYDRFIEIAQKELPEHLQLFLCSEVQHYRNIFLKIHDAETTYIESHSLKFEDANHGVFIDVMPLSGVPKSWIHRKIFCLKIIWYRVINDKRRFPYKGNQERSLIGKILWILLYPFIHIHSYHYYSDKWIKLLKRYSFDNSQYTGYVWCDWITKKIFPTQCFGKGCWIEFEDTKICCPSDPDTFLKIMFGDYMKLPPVEEQCAQHEGIIDLNKPYRTYLNEI